MEAVKHRILLLIFALFVVLSSCKRETPVEMLFGNWKITQVTENQHNLTSEFLKDNSPYLKLTESGYYQIGLLDSSGSKSWIAYPESNELLLADNSIYDNIKKWEVKAADDILFLEYPKRDIQIKLERLQKFPEPAIRSTTDLVGKWKFHKITINGINSTDNYPNTDRWIILAKNGRFYNGADKGNQNAGFWEVDELFKTVEFKNSKDQSAPAIIFHINKNQLWYEKEKNGSRDYKVRVYFKKENS